ncbi:sensor histidine kinase [Microlunatus antarcticus]|uniref:histidine kinase n=1 Tax=Microlunatus antarcticus TaxID=53388 RepID=A0A7W5JVU8_9ACTN|nr:signal transduction histidine kinase [Microlunatus antarcticus]
MSIRTRVIAAVMVVLVVVLLVLSLSVQSVFATQSERNVDALLSGRAQLARQLARSGVRPQQIVNRVGVDGVLASLQLRDGTVIGSPLPVGGGVQTVTTRLNGPTRVDGAELTLSVNSSLATGALQSLRRILLVGGLVALALSAALVALAVRLALRPLDAMAALAQGIAGGARGRRLSPTRTHTEIGRTAQAFDEMLDELEGAEAQSRTAETDALRAEERVRAFVADAAHELRTPLTGVRAAAETLLEHGGTLDVGDREHLEVLLIAEAQRAGRLVDDLVALARLDTSPALDLAPVEVARLVDDEVVRARLLSPTATITAAGAAPVVSGDLTSLRGALRNLMDNARRAAGPRGTVTVTSAVHGDLAVVHVRDDGPGVPAADRERIFDRLVRLDPARSADSGGIGLGLAIARGIARAHGGDLVCVPVEPTGGGADFCLTLPLRVTTDPAGQPAEPRPSPGRPGTGETADQEA